MSLKFGIYLVEQRIINPEQFCGLIKIQQESAMSLATVAVRRNVMTIKQVAKVLTLVEENPSSGFLETAQSEKLIDEADSARLLHEQQLSCPTLRKLIVECGLLTQHQTEVLYSHFEKLAAQGLKSQLPATNSAHSISAEAPTSSTTFSPPTPKFSQRSVPTRAYSQFPQ